MSTELIINASLPETRIAMTEEGRIQELVIERAGEKGIVGNIYKGRVTRVLPGMQAAFVDIGLEKAAFLYVDDVFVHPTNFRMEDEAEITDTTESFEEVAVATLAPPTENAEQDALAEPHELAQQSEPEESAAFESSESDEEIESENDQDIQSQAEEFVASESAEEVAEPVPNTEELQSDEVSVSESPSDESAPPPPSSGPLKIAVALSKLLPRGGRRRRGRGKRGRNDEREENEQTSSPEQLPDHAIAEMEAVGPDESDRSAMSESFEQGDTPTEAVQSEESSPPASTGSPSLAAVKTQTVNQQRAKMPEWKQQRARDRRIPSRGGSARGPKHSVTIDQLLKEGQEVLVQVAKDPISTKGARLTCHISLAGRHLVCMPTIDHIGVSRRIESDEERRKLRQFVDRVRPKKMGFIVRTASGGKESEIMIKQDIDYLASIWEEIISKANEVSAPALVYEDLNSVLRAVRDWVTEDIQKIIVDSRYYYQELKQFVRRFTPELEERIELYQGDVPIFDSYGISNELHRAMERKVWLKSGGYIVIDQAEALVAIDVNTGRFVGKRSLEDTILKTNLEAVEEVAYQLRLRNCGGIIIIDLIDMEREENRHRVYRALENALKHDRARPSIIKMSDLGLIEMTRKRTRDTIVRALCTPCTHCEGKGYVKSKNTVAYEILREIERASVDRDSKKVLVKAHPEVIDFLAIDERDTLDQLEKRFKKQIYLQADYEFHSEQFEVVGDRVQPMSVTQRKAIQARGGEDRSRGRFSGGRSGRGGRDRDRERGGKDRSGRDRDRGGRDRDRDRSSAPKESAPLNPTKIVLKPRVELGGAEGEGERVLPPEHEIPNVSSAPIQDADSVGNRVQSDAITPKPEEFDEEDRLAFLRAQAAQDAALSGKPTPSGFGRGNGGGGSQQNRFSQRGGNGGGRHRRGGRRGGGGPNRERPSPGAPLQPLQSMPQPRTQESTSEHKSTEVTPKVTSGEFTE
jgi:ribonuclease G